MRRLAYVVSQFPEMHETFILREVLELRRRGYEITVFSLKPCRDSIIHPDAGALMAKTVYAPFVCSWVLWRAQAIWWLCRPVRTCSTLAQMIWLHLRTPGQLVKLLMLWPKLMYYARIMQRQRIRHLHAHWATIPASAAMVISRLLDVKWSLTAHAWDIFVRNPLLSEKIRRAELVLTCTEYNRRFLISLVPEASSRIIRIYHGVRVPPRTSREPSAAGIPQLLAVGRLVGTKGFKYLIEACHRLKRRRVSFACTIVGEGPDRRRLEAQIRTLGLASDVKLIGALPHAEIQLLYRQAMVFVLPCVIARDGDRDGIPNVIFEAMAAGVPVVSTAVSGIPEVVRSEKTGFLIPERDPEALAAALNTLLADANRARIMGESARICVERDFAESIHMDILDRAMRAQMPSCEQDRILYVIWSLAVGGAERVVSLLAQRLDRAHYQPVIACLNDTGALAEGLRMKGVRVIGLGKRGPIDLSMLWRLMQLIRRERIDLVHAHLWGGNVWGRLAAYLSARPVVITEHNVDTWKRLWHLAIDRLLARGTRRIVAVSQAVRDFYVGRGIPAARCEIIHNGIETERFAGSMRRPIFADLGWAENCPVFVSVGRLVPAKDHARFIEVMAQVIERRAQARGLIVGEGALREALERQIRDRGLSERIILTGLREDIPAILKASRAVVFTSQREGLPMSLLEAMASGLPAVATPVGGVPEVVVNGETGWLIARDDLQEFVARLIQLVDEPQLAHEAGARARRHVCARWSVDAMTRAHEKLYADVLRPRIRVSYIIDDLNGGGAQHQLLELARRLPPERFAVEVISLSQTKQQLRESFHTAGIQLTTIHQEGKWSWSCLRALAGHLRRRKPQVVHTWLFTSDLYGRLAARLAGVPIVISSVRSAETWKKRSYIWADRALQYLSDRITVNVEMIRPILMKRERIRPEKICTIYNGVDLTRFAARNGAGASGSEGSSAGAVVGLIARLVPEKDPITFIRAAGRIGRAIPTARFIVVGDGPLRDDLASQAHREGIYDRVTFTGFRQDRAAILQTFDVLVLSSIYEGCANVILEAMAMGRPVVATDVGGNRELVVHNQTGLLVPSRAPSALADAVITLLNNPQRAEAMGLEGRRRVVERFTMERVVDETSRMYAELLARRGYVTAGHSATAGCGS